MTRHGVGFRRGAAMAACPAPRDGAPADRGDERAALFAARDTQWPMIPMVWIGMENIMTTLDDDVRIDLELNERFLAANEARLRRAMTHDLKWQLRKRTDEVRDATAATLRALRLAGILMVARLSGQPADVAMVRELVGAAREALNLLHEVAGHDPEKAVRGDWRRIPTYLARLSAFDPCTSGLSPLAGQGMIHANVCSGLVHRYAMIGWNTRKEA